MKEDAFSLLEIGVVGLGIAVVGGHLFTRWVLRKNPSPGGGRYPPPENRCPYWPSGAEFRASRFYRRIPESRGLRPDGRIHCRFDELRDREFAEYFLVGTLASVFLIPILTRPALPIPENPAPIINFGLGR